MEKKKGKCVASWSEYIKDKYRSRKGSSRKGSSRKRSSKKGSRKVSKKGSVSRKNL